MGSICCRRPGPDRPRPVGVDDEQLSRIELADEGRPRDVEGRRLRRQDPAVVQLAEAQGPEPVGIPHPDEALMVEQNEGERPLQGRQHRHEGGVQAVAHVTVQVADEQFGDQVAVAGDRAGEHADVGGQGLGVGQVAVVAEGEDHGGARSRPGEEVRYTGWALCQVRRPGGRVAGVADGQVALEAGQVALVEDVGDQAHVLDDHHLGRRRSPPCRPTPGPGAGGRRGRRSRWATVAPGGVDAEDAARLPGLGVLDRSVLWVGGVGHPASVARPARLTVDQAGLGPIGRRGRTRPARAPVPCGGDRPAHPLHRV